MGWQWRLARSAVRKQLLQSLLLILGVALGTAVIIAIDLANQSALKGFELSAQTLTGKATHQVTASGGVPDSLYRELKQKFPHLASAPVITGYVDVDALKNRPLRLLGVDPLAEAPFRNYLNPQGQQQDLQAFLPFISRVDSLMVGQELMTELKNAKQIMVQYGAQTRNLEIVGVLNPDAALVKQSLKGVLLADIGTAQNVLNKKGKLSHIDFIIPKVDVPTVLPQLKAALPVGTTIQSAQAQASTMEQMTRAFSLNLSALSLLALMVGMFLIYNTISFSVVRRREQIGILRALGVTRREIFSQVLLETFLLALIGVLLGIGLGIVMGRGALALVTRTINDLYFSLEVNRFSLSAWSLLKGSIGGLVAAGFAACLPAFEATRATPAGVMRKTGLESQIHKRLKTIAAVGLVIMALGIGLLWIPTQDITLSFVCFFMVVAGAALWVPGATFLLMKLFESSSFFKMPARNVSRSLSRTSVAIASLMVAISVVVSVSIMVGSFRQTVVDWLDNTLSADIFMTLPTRPGDTGIGLPPELLAKVRQIEGVERADSARDVRLPSQYGVINLVALTRDIAKKRRYVWHTPPREEVWQELQAGEVLVSQPFATRNGIQNKAGQRIQLQTDKGPQSFEVAGVYYDYASERGSVLLADTVYRKYWNDTYISSMAAFVQSGQNADTVIKRLQTLTDGKYRIVVQSNVALRKGAIEVFDRTFAITSALRLLAIVVAFMGILSTLMALLLERTREFGILRALGMTRGRLAVQILTESGLMGLTAGVLALPLGTVLSLFLIYVINLRSFGWTMDFLAKPAFFGQGLWLALVAALLAGIYPAIYLYRTRPAEALRYE